ncbi:MAG: phosphatidylcholine/phosphatidylserine synthase [Alphaproteobacteria bacterium]|nr:phosphatidylcholine/phosphatidylserine synthase [Alphaproteobacteria bacterium]
MSLKLADNPPPINGDTTSESDAYHQISLIKMVPSLITLMALIAGITSLQKSISGDYEGAVMMLLVAAVFDVLDGAVARILKAQSEFGAQLDSLSDFLAFGVAPAILLHEWTMIDAGKLGWIASVVFPVAAALRLARFNVATKETSTMPLWKKRYFSGVPTPAGAGLVMMPIYVWFLSPETFGEFKLATPLIAVWTICVAAMMVSRIPTASLKYMKLPDRMAVPLMAAIGLIVAAMIHAPWVTLTLISSAYLISVPLALNHYRKLEQRFEKRNEDLSSLAFGIDEINMDASNEEDQI